MQAIKAFFDKPEVNKTCKQIDRQSQGPRGLRRGSAASRLLGSWVRITPGTRIFIFCECCVVSGSDLWDDKLITRSEKSYRLCCILVYDPEISRERRPWSTGPRGGEGE